METAKDESLCKAAEASTGQGNVEQGVNVCVDVDILEYLGQEFGRKVRGPRGIGTHCWVESGKI
jgi:hypothetical protein